MAQDIRQDFGTDSAVTIALDGLANGSSATSNAIDLGNPGPFALSLEVTLNGTSASNTERADVYAQWSNDNADFSDSGNDLLVGTVVLNGTTGVIKVLSVPVFARHVKIRVENNSGDALSSGSPSENFVRYVPISVDQA